MSNPEVRPHLAVVRTGGRTRRRNSLLTCLEICRELHPAFGLPDAVAFLYICENEGLTMAELAHVTRDSVPTVSRRARSLARPGSPGALEPCLGLVDFLPNPEDDRGRLMRLTDDGRELCARLDDVIGAAIPIADGTVQ
jgi:DNA-binding MarR family transcriptional regulator